MFESCQVEYNATPPSDSTDKLSDDLDKLKVEENGDSVENESPPAAVKEEVKDKKRDDAPPSTKISSELLTEAENAKATVESTEQKSPSKDNS